VGGRTIAVDGPDSDDDTDTDENDGADCRFVLSIGFREDIGALQSGLFDRMCTI
jgi:hypothetical protein